MFKVIVAGSREFLDYQYMKRMLDALLSLHDSDVQIVSGRCRGADKLGERYARERGFSLKLFPADWGKHGKAAGAIRNEEMARYGDALVCFRINNSSGSTDMIQRAEAHKLKVKTFDITI